MWNKYLYRFNAVLHVQCLSMYVHFYKKPNILYGLTYILYNGHSMYVMFLGCSPYFLYSVQIEDYLRDLFLSMTSRPSWVEGLRSLLMAPFWFMGGARSNHALLLQYVKTVMKLNEESRQLLSELEMVPDGMYNISSNSRSCLQVYNTHTYVQYTCCQYPTQLYMEGRRI